MSEYDAQLYDQYSSGVRKQVQTLRTILQSLQAKSQDRTWLKNQTSGELDDNRIIDGLTGERSIYKKRGDQDPEVGDILLLYVVKPKSKSQFKNLSPRKGTGTGTNGTKSH